MLTDLESKKLDAQIKAAEKLNDRIFAVILVLFGAAIGYFLKR